MSERDQLADLERFHLLKNSTQIKVVLMLVKKQLQF